jgi:hypothetical protein
MAYDAVRNWRGCRVGCDCASCLFYDPENLTSGISGKNADRYLIVGVGVICDS